jgi:hypothetical protein
MQDREIRRVRTKKPVGEERKSEALTRLELDVLENLAKRRYVDCGER